MQKKLPQNFIKKLEKIFSKEELEKIFNWYSIEKRPVTLRVNTIKANNNEIENELSKNNILFEKIPYLTNWYKLANSKESDLWKLDIFTEWKIYLQWVTSQFLWEIIKSDLNNENIKVLDLTAAPWWKTSHISALSNSNWEIIANEINSIRLEKLKFNLNRQWCTNVKIIKWDARNLKNIYSENYFDIIIADLPCSAEWRINLNNEKTYKYLENHQINQKNYKLQKDILENSIWLLKQNWTLIYSTCTIDPRENEWVIHFLISNYKNLILEDISNFFQDKNIFSNIKTWIKSFDKYIYNSSVSKAIRILPSKETEWFFIAKIKKIWV